MITIQDINKAKTNRKYLLEIYHKIFFDGKKPKLKMWLINNGIRNNDIEDMEQLMAITFVVNLYKYNYSKIPFEKWIWVKFKQCLENYRFQKKYIKKNSNIISLTDIIEDNNDEFLRKLDIGYINEDDMVDYDFNKIISAMNNIQSFISKCKFYNGWSNKEIRNYLNGKGISDKQFDEELKNVINVFNSYLNGKI